MEVWCYDVDMAEDADLTEGDMHLARTPISNPSTAVAIIIGLLFLRGVFHDSIPLLYFFVLRKSVRVPKMEVCAPA